MPSKAVTFADSSFIALTRTGTNRSYFKPYAVLSSFRLTTNISSLLEGLPSIVKTSWAKNPICFLLRFLLPSGVLSSYQARLSQRYVTGFNWLIQFNPLVNSVTSVLSLESDDDIDVSAQYILETLLFPKHKILSLVSITPEGELPLPASLPINVLLAPVVILYA